MIIQMDLSPFSLFFILPPLLFTCVMSNCTLLGGISSRFLGLFLHTCSEGQACGGPGLMMRRDVIYVLMGERGRGFGRGGVHIADIFSICFTIYCGFFFM